MKKQPGRLSLTKKNRLSSGMDMENNTRNEKNFPGEGINCFILNRKVLDFKKMQNLLTGALEPAKLTSAGGLLFKAALKGKTLELGILPNFYEGERGYHHDIHLEHEDEFTLIGGIAANRELTILFKCTAMDDEKRKIYRNVYCAFAELLRLCNKKQTVTLAWITVKMMEDQQLFSPVPGTVEEIAAAKTRDGG